MSCMSGSPNLNSFRDSGQVAVQLVSCGVLLPGLVQDCTQHSCVNYRGITLTSIAAKIYNALLRNRIEPKIDNILRKNQNGFRRNRSTTSQILTIRRILEGVRAKNLQATLIFVDFTKAFDSIHRGKMEQILLAYGIPKETVAAITILYRNTKVKVRSPDGDSEYFDIVAGVLQGDTLAPYLFIICLDYVLRTSIDKIKENGFELTKKRSRRYPATTITDADYADDIAILANTPDQAETLLHSLERAAASIGLHVNAHKTEYMCYNQTGDISTLEGTPLKLVDKFTYLGSSVESTEKDKKKIFFIIQFIPCHIICFHKGVEVVVADIFILICLNSLDKVF